MFTTGRWALIEAIQHVPAGHPLRQRKEDILTRPGNQAKNVAKVAVARQLLTWVFYAKGMNAAASLPKDTTCTRGAPHLP